MEEPRLEGLSEWIVDKGDTLSKDRRKEGPAPSTACVRTGLKCLAGAQLLLESPELGFYQA